ncbi:uncharacterized protein LOC127092582 [Lathyrus oleraceus]|uniref:Uncharacterized protein n=1 Tax=Pisum sativum TaxID=3888 RepID=A0A9D5A491_PEA|nr:uncharacterized protein LOC127092582 [Pisum sativum]KAI5396997.1 hypothetical protein KIW84_062993 [Pisum sativum]
MMETEVMLVAAVPSIDFNFNTNCSSSTYITDPSTPQLFPNNFSFTSLKDDDKPIIINNDQDFEFNFNIHLQSSSLSADELFHAGKILPLNLISPPPPPPPHHGEQQETEKKLVKQQQQQNKLYGRERSSSFSFPTCRDHRKYSKLSHGNKGSSATANNNVKQAETSYFSSFLSTISFSRGYRKWRLKDFLLFRSASEGRGSDRDPLRKYRVLSKTTEYEDVGNSSFRSVENSGSVSKRRKPVSAHELHYTLNRAASEELKRKTMLPYKQGLLGCMGFNQGMNNTSRRF